MSDLINRQAEIGDGYYLICPKCKRMMREVIQKIGDTPVGNSWFVCQDCNYMMREDDRS